MAITLRVSLIAVGTLAASGVTHADPKVLRDLEVEQGRIQSVAFSPDGKTLAAVSGKLVKVWDVQSGKEVAVLKQDLRAFAIAFSPDGKTLAWCNRPDIPDGKALPLSKSPGIILWDTATQKERHTLTGHEGVYRIAFHPKSNVLASAGTGSVVLWDVESGKQLRKLDAGDWTGRGLEFSRDGKMLARGGRVWDTESYDNLTGKFKGDRRANYTPTAVAFTPDSEYLLVGTGHWQGPVTYGIWIERRGKGEEPKAVWDSKHLPFALVFSPDGRWLVLDPETEVVEVVDWSTMKKVATLKAPGRVESIAVSTDGKTVAAACASGTVRLWTLDLGK